MVTDADRALMARALFHAARGAGRTAPNPMVGAVVVSADGVVVGHGWHERAGEAHAEVHALDAAGARAAGGTMYVTLEPCCHHGRTGPCTARLIEAGIRRVVAAMPDPDPRVDGRGFAVLREHGLVVDEGLCADEAMRLNAAFVSAHRRGRPLMVLKAATSLDARVAARPGLRTALSSRAANRRTQQLRASVDAIAVGSETVLVDDPLLTVRECFRDRPLARVIFDRRLRTPADARLWTTLAAGPVIIVTAPLDADRQARADRLQEAGARIVAADTLAEGVTALLAHHLLTVLVEGGPTLQRGLVRAGLVDRLHLVVTPHMLGDAGVRWLDCEEWPTTDLAVVTAEMLGTDTWVEADVHRTR